MGRLKLKPQKLMAGSKGIQKHYSGYNDQLKLIDLEGKAAMVDFFKTKKVERDGREVLLYRGRKFKRALCTCGASWTWIELKPR